MRIVFTITLITFASWLTPQVQAGFSDGKSMDAGFAMAGTLGFNVPPECKALVKKIGSEVEKRVYDGFLIPVCKKTICKPTHDQLRQYWAHLKKTVEMMVAKIPKLTKPPFNFEKLEGNCKQFQPILAWSNLWKEAKPIVKKCALADNSVAKKEVNKADICKGATEKDFKETAGCFKTEGTPVLMSKYMHLIPAAVPCAQELIEKYCNDKHLKVWVDHNTKKALEDRKEYGDMNPFNHVQGFMITNNCKATPKVKNDPDDM